MKVQLEKRIETLKDLQDLAKESEGLSLGDGSPKQGQAFYLFRGVPDCQFELLSSIQVYLSVKKKDTNWRTKIEDFEREQINRFLKEVEPYRELNNQYHWFCPPGPKTDTFWYLSVMQHFSCPTRLCDFTADFWTAIFFATVGATNDKDLGLYRLKCLNDDSNGNKLPKDSEGNAWFAPFFLNVSDLLGNIIGYEGFTDQAAERKHRLNLFQTKNDKSQRFGWDTPHFQNARIRKQRGFFVYNLDLKTPLEDSILEHSQTEFKKYAISAAILDEIRDSLKKKGLEEWKVYLDLDRLFNSWKS